MDWVTWASDKTAALLLGPVPTLALVAGLLVWAGLSDLRRYLIPNAAVGLAAALGLVYQVQVGGPAGSALLIAATVLAVGFLGFAIRLFGAGDAKLLAAVALLAGPSEILPFLTQTLLIGGGLALLWLAARPLRHGLVLAGFHVAAEPARQLPYGVAIAGGGLLLIARLWPGL
ncbi:MAG: prepilin peptidase [Alphaproteobacteria bacterium]|nr:prepilin peptidase [Alphaproteobacteria bacterium]